MTETEALQRYDAFLWKQVHAFCRRSRRKQQPLEDFIQEARIAFLQHIRTHPESEWTDCKLTIMRALFDFARAEYPLTCSHHGFRKILREKKHFYPYDEYLTSFGERHEDDHTDIDLREALAHLSEIDQQVIVMRLEGFTQREIASRTGRTPQAISRRMQTIRRKMIS